MDLLYLETAFKWAIEFIRLLIKWDDCMGCTCIFKITHIGPDNSGAPLIFKLMKVTRWTAKGAWPPLRVDANADESGMANFSF